VERRKDRTAGRLNAHVAYHLPFPTVFCARGARAASFGELCWRTSKVERLIQTSFKLSPVACPKVLPVAGGGNFRPLNMTGIPLHPPTPPPFLPLLAMTPQPVARECREHR